MKVKRESEVTQSCPTLSNPMDCSPPGSSPMGFSRQEYWSGVPFGCLHPPNSPFTKALPSFTTYVHPTLQGSPPLETPPATHICPRGAHPKELSLRLQDSPRMQTSGPSFSLQLLQALQAKDKTLWKNSLSQKAAHVHQSQYTVYSKTICHSRGLVINFPSCKYIPLGVRTASSCYPRKL